MPTCPITRKSDGGDCQHPVKTDGDICAVHKRELARLIGRPSWFYQVELQYKGRPGKSGQWPNVRIGPFFQNEDDAWRYLRLRWPEFIRSTHPKTKTAFKGASVRPSRHATKDLFS